MTRESALTAIGRRSLGGRATLEEVARVARVSRATASRVVNGDPRVGEVARAAVQDAIRELRYVPNPAARSLVTRRTDSIAVIIPEPAGQLFGDPFFPRILRGISDALTRAEVQLVLLMPQGERDEARVERYLAAGHVDGAILASLHGPDPLPAQLRRRGIPVVCAGRPPTAGVSYVDVDNRAGAASAVSHLVELGRRQIATIAGPQDMTPGADRLTGYRETLSAAGRQVDERLVEVADFTQRGGRTAMERLLVRAPEIDAVFVASDLMATGALGALRAARRRVPDDVALVGFDDSPLATSAEPPLSSVRQPIEEMGREVARLVLDASRQRAAMPRRVILDTELVVRESSGGTAGVGAKSRRER